LGEELITNEIIAIVELVKNSYDADATRVKITLENVTDIEKGRIIIHDDGVGMSLDTIINAWLQPGTEVKKHLRERNERTEIYRRFILGEKGVGRFAAQKLGSLITVTTRSRESELETIVEVDWSAFEEDKFLSDVKVKWLQTEPKIFQKTTGTQLEINFINKKWTGNMIYELVHKLVSLQSPFKEKDNFTITIESNDYPEVSKEVQFPIRTLENAVYSFSGKVSERGLMTGNYRFINPAYRKFARKISISGKDIRDPENFLKGNSTREPLCGNFSFEFYVWDLDPISLKETISRTTYDRYIEPHTGIRVYRDGFRVWPYGEKGNDWLELDLMRVNNPSKCLSNNQVIGIVEIGQEGNPSLRDKTDREGIIDNVEYHDFKILVLSALNELEILRRQDKIKIDNMRERRVGKKIDETLDKIDNMRHKIHDNSHDDLYHSEIDAIEKAYEKYKVDIVERLYVAAGIGIAALMPAHEVQIQLKDLKPPLDGLKADMIRMGFGGRMMDRFDNIEKIMSNLWEVSQGALELQKRYREEFSLLSVVEFSLKIKRQELDRAGIRVIEPEKTTIRLKGYPNLLMTAILNLLDNAIWWLQKNPDEKILKITIKKDSPSRALIIVSDNGPGIDPSDLPYLGEAFYTRKPKGTGLGLFISKRLMEANNGVVEFGFYPNDPDFLQGANVILAFEIEGE
jgi:signal transduction histidine kinase